MRLFILFTIGAMVAGNIAAPSPLYSVHEKREIDAASEWIKRDITLDSRTIVPFSIALKQENLQHGYDFLRDVSDPSSPNYGQHWTAEKVGFGFRTIRAFPADLDRWHIPLPQVQRLFNLSKHGSRLMVLSKKGFSCLAVETGFV